MPDGKPAGVRCVQLLADERCGIFGSPSGRSAAGAAVGRDVRGSREQAMHWLGWLERETSVSV